MYTTSRACEDVGNAGGRKNCHCLNPEREYLDVWTRSDTLIVAAIIVVRGLGTLCYDVLSKVTGDA